MASVVKIKGRGRGVRYRVEFCDAQGKTYYIRGFNYRPAAEAVRQQIDRLEQLRRAGKRPDGDLATWPTRIDPAWRDRLARAGLIDSAHLLNSKPIAYHLIGFYNAIRAKGRTRRHARQIVRRVVKIARGPAYWTWRQADNRKRPAPASAIRFVSELTPGLIESHLAELRDNGKGITAQTYNHYLQAAKQFCRWLVTVGRAERNPLAHVRPLERGKVRAECKRERRAATVDEMRALMMHLSTDAAGDYQGVPASERRLVYWLAAMTGLRASEIKSLTAGDFDLSDAEPAVTIRARSAKNRKDATIALPIELAEAIGEHLADKTLAAPAFHLPHVTGFARMLKADVEAAGVAYTDAAGRTLDFHALRHTRGVWLFQHHGATSREVQELMRVSSVALVDRYARSFRLTDNRLIERAPDLTTPNTMRQRATGTDDAQAQKNAQDAHRKQRQTPAHSDNHNRAGDRREHVFSIQNPRFNRENSKPPTGLEPVTCGLQNRCSAN